jgi:hypothetical protein
MKNIAQAPVTNGFVRLLASDQQAYLPPGLTGTLSSRNEGNTSLQASSFVINMARSRGLARPLFCSSTHAPGHPHCTCTHHHHDVR